MMIDFIKAFESVHGDGYLGRGVAKVLGQLCFVRFALGTQLVGAQNTSRAVRRPRQPRRLGRVRIRLGCPHDSR